MTASEYQIRVKTTRNIPISKISSGKHQVRTHNVDANLSYLVNSMKKFGLLQPITVYETDGNYELLAGQRRLTAARQLEWDEIRATIIEKPSDDVISKAISFFENQMQEKMNKKDVINACQEFYYKFGTIKMVAEELAIPPAWVRDSIN